MKDEQAQSSKAVVAQNREGGDDPVDRAAVRAMTAPTQAANRVERDKRGANIMSRRL